MSRSGILISLRDVMPTAPSGKAVIWCLVELADQDAKLAATILCHYGSLDGKITPEDLTPLLTSEYSQLREAALRVMGRRGKEIRRNR